MSESTNNAIIYHIGLKNFKGYQDADISLAPLTLFFGPNSAGKSTVFQVLYLLKQTLQFAPEDVPLLFRCDNGYVDLGSFEDVVHDHDVNKEISIEINGQAFTFRIENKKLTLAGIEIEANTGVKDVGGLTPEKSYSSDEIQELPNIVYQYSIKNADGTFRAMCPSSFYPLAYKLIHKHREKLAWALEQVAVVKALNDYLEPDPPAQSPKALKELKSILLKLRACFPNQKEEDGMEYGPPEWMFDTRWDGLGCYHLGANVDLREIVSKTEYEGIREAVKQKSWDNPFEPGVVHRNAIDSSEIKEERVRDLFDQLKAKLHSITQELEYRNHLQRHMKCVEPEIAFLKREFKEKELWEMMNVHPDGLEVQIRHFLPDTYADFEKRGDHIVEAWLGLLAVSGINLTADHNFPERMYEVSEVKVFVTYSDWNGDNKLPKLSRTDKIPDQYPLIGWDGEGEGVPAAWFFNEKYPSEMGINSTRGRERFISWVQKKDFPLNKYISPGGRVSCNNIRNVMSRDFKPIGAIRQAPRRLYWSSKSVAGNVGFMGEWVGDVLLDEGCKTEVNKWLIRLTGYEVEREDVGSILPGAYVLKVRDTRRKGAQYVKITDVGFGISQVLPLVAQLVASKESIITVEQPESQIHPALQADFAELVVWSMKESKNQVLIETHSEHLALRIQALIHKGDVLPNDVSVVYVQRNEKGSSIQQLQLDEQGRFKDAWPGGFFPERRKDMLALLEDKDEQ